MKIRCWLACLLLVAAVAPAAAESAPHPLAQGAPLTLTTSPQLGFGLERLQWGPTTLSYSQSWMGGRSSSLGLLTRDLRVPLGGQLDFSARFGLAFTPSGQQLGGEEGARFVLPYAALDWRPGDSFRLRVEVGQGLGYSPYGYSPWHSAGLLSPFADKAPIGDE